MTEQDRIYTCPNCDFEYRESFQYCPQCGQHHEESLLSFKEMFFDLLGAFFSFDTKAVRSIPRLLFLPGTLTLEYVRGKRQTYLPPFRLYLFISIVLFLLLPLVLKDDAFIPKDGLQFTEDTGDSTVTQDVHLEDLIVQGFTDAITEDTVEELDSMAARDPEADSLIKSVKDKTNWNFTTSTENDGIINFGTSDSSESNSWSRAQALIEEGLSPEEAVDSIFANASKRNQFFMSQGLKLQTRRGEGLMSAFLDVASYTLFIFLPLFALWLKVLYVRRKRFYIEHLIFSLHYFSFFFLLTIFYVLIDKYLFNFPFWIVAAISLVYLYVAMFKVYKQNWFKTFMKWFLLLFTTSSLFLPIFFIIALFISVIFY